MTPDISVIIIAYNEERNLERCLRSLPPGAEIIVLDSHSQDQTVAIARSFGARVEQRAFTHFAEQKNAALDLATRSWVLAVDADEELSPELRERLGRIMQNPEQDAFRLDRHLVFMGRPMRFGKTRDRPIRFFKRLSARYEGAIHEELKLKDQARLGFLKGAVLWHYSYLDLSDYFQRFNRYTSAIAEQHEQLGKEPAMLPHLLRPWAEFFSRYILRLGFLDGYAGYTYALISSLYAYIKYAKLIERRHGR